MPAVRQYASNADRQAAYRQRQVKARAELLAAKNMPALPAIATLPGTARWKALLDSARAQIGTAIEEMREYHADRSEAWQESDKGSEFEEMIDQWQEQLDGLDSLAKA